MDFLKNLEKDTIVICNNDNKKDILKKLNASKMLVSIKIIDFNELIKNMTVFYDEKSIYYISTKYNIKPSVAKIYIDNLKYIEDKDYTSTRLNFLREIKTLLDKENLGIKNELFEEEVRNKDIIIYDYKYLNKYEKNIVSKLEKLTNVKIINKKYETFKHDVYRFNTLKEEVNFVANKICSLLANNVDINNIKLVNLNKDYYKEIKRVFKIYNIPVELNDNVSIYGNRIVKDFFLNYKDDLNVTFKFLKDKYNDNSIIKILINICNKYYFINNSFKKEFIKEEVKNTKAGSINYLKSVKEIDLFSSSITDDSHVFLLGFNEGIIPKTYKDEDYITDDIKDFVLLDKTDILNKRERQKTIEKINSIKNLYISYKLSSQKEKYYKSSIQKFICNDEIYIDSFNYSYSNLKNKLELSRYLDTYVKYGTYNKDIDILYNTYKDIPYKKYDNSFKGIDSKDYLKYLDNKLVLSYSSLDNYNKCGFKYYMANVLKIDKFNDTYYTFIGSLFHYILEKYYKEKIGVNLYIDKYVKDNNIVLDNKGMFFLNKLKKELFFIIDAIDEQVKYTKLNDILTEEKIEIKKSYGDVEITFKGFVDKILYKDYGDKTVAVLIDYKTGNQDVDLSKVKYGLCMQLPIYLYLARNSKLKNIEFAGFYLQKILNKEILKSDKKSYLEQKFDNLKLIGYSNTNPEILKEFDLTYKDSKVVKGLKIKENGDFYSYSKVLNNEEINDLIDLASLKIEEAGEHIINHKFDINPKVINNENVSCKFCKFKDICFVTEKDKVFIEE